MDRVARASRLRYRFLVPMRVHTIMVALSVNRPFRSAFTLSAGRSGLAGSGNRLKHYSY